MAANRRMPRGGPVPAGSGRMPEGGRLVAPSGSKAQAQRLREAMLPSRPSRVRMVGERWTLDFFRDALGEMRKVHWPTPVQARNLTGLVIAVSVVVGIILGGVDYVFSKVFEFILQMG